MTRIIGLEEYVQSDRYRKGIGITANQKVAYSFLAQGEYNCNYRFSHPVTGENLVLRLNFGSQLHLEQQITYEFEALKKIYPSGRTPKPIYLDDAKDLLPHGVMVMEFLRGRPLDYRTDLQGAAGCLADIHSTKISDVSGLIYYENPLLGIIEECEQMFRVYEECPYAPTATKKRIRDLLGKGRKLIFSLPFPADYLCLVNTELNNTNFLVDREKGKTRLIDWEKPVYGEPAQDLGHFLAPTTTFWKTDTILGKEKISDFIRSYIRAVDGRFDTETLAERVAAFLPVTCLRGITWCAMAWVEYQNPERVLRNASTEEKLEQYLSDKFLSAIENLF